MRAAFGPFVPFAPHEPARLSIVSPEFAELFSDGLDPEVVSEVRAFPQTGTPLGAERFRVEIERALKISAGRFRKGRPKRQGKGANSESN